MQYKRVFEWRRAKHLRRAPLFAPPLEVLCALIFLIFDEKLIINSYNVLQSRSKVSTRLSKGPPTETIMCR